MDEFTLISLGENSQGLIRNVSLLSGYKGMQLAQSRANGVEWEQEIMMQKGVSKNNAPLVPRIEFRNVSLAYDDLVVLDEVSFALWPAELKLFLGESGGGKSTVIKLALGLEKPDAGEILIDGEDITRLSEEELDRVREKMGVVFQEGALFDSLTVFEMSPTVCRNMARTRQRSSAR